MPQAPSTRWCPTPEQLMILEEMYRSGIRTPNASQIQQITAHLSYYGKIEGKNVFYWFQNHKARDRQKLRRRLSRHHQLLHIHPASVTAVAGGGAQSTLGGQQSYGFHGFEETSPLPSPTSISYPSTTPLFHQETSGGEMNLLSKLDVAGQEAQAAATSSGGGAVYVHDWMAMTGGGGSVGAASCSTVPLCCRPLKTLDLFPTKSSGAGLKEECSTSKSSCSISNNWK